MIIKNGLVIDPASGLSEKWIFMIEDGHHQRNGIPDYKRRRGSP